MHKNNTSELLFAGPILSVLMLLYLHANGSCSAQNLVLFTVIVSAIGIELPMIYLIERFTRRKSLSWFVLIGITLLLTYVSIYFVGAYIFIYAAGFCI